MAELIIVLVVVGAILLLRHGAASPAAKAPKPDPFAAEKRKQELRHFGGPSDPPVGSEKKRPSKPEDSDFDN